MTTVFLKLKLQEQKDNIQIPEPSTVPLDHHGQESELERVNEVGWEIRGPAVEKSCQVVVVILRWLTLSQVPTEH